MASQNIWDGTLSQDDFYVAAKALCERWKQTNSTLPQWTWISSRRLPMGAASCKDGYLSLENVYHFSSNEDRVDELNFSDKEEHVDSATLVQGSIEETHIYNYHIVYNFSYMVPVLYFRGCNSDGQPLDLENIKKDLPDYSLRLLEQSKWTFMTQEEHPFLHRPWYTLHPCGTSDWMKLLLGATPLAGREIIHYLPSWLSVVGQTVGLKIPHDPHEKSRQEHSISSNTESKFGDEILWSQTSTIDLQSVKSDFI